MHLKTAVKCLSVLLAAGLLHDEPRVSARSWKKKVREEYSVLCPPQKTQPALNVQPVADVRWGEVPSLQKLYQEALDWLIWIETTDIDAVRQGLLKIFSAYTLYDSEFRQVAGKFLLAAKELLFEELRIWTAVGPDMVLNLLTEFSEHFRGTVFLTTSPECHDFERVDMRTVLSANVWKQVAKARTATSSSLPILCISSTPPLRQLGNRTVLTPTEAVREWHANECKHFCCVEVSLKEAIDPLAFFGVRLSMQIATEPQHVTIFFCGILLPV